MTRGRSVVQGVFAVLAELGRGGELGPSELAVRTGLPKATVHRLLEQLLEQDAVERVGGRYRLGPTMFRLGVWRPAQRLRIAALRPMRELAAAVSGTTVNLVLPYGNATVIAGVIPGETIEALPMRAGGVLGPDSEPGYLWAAHAPDGELPPGVPLGRWRRRVGQVRARGGIVYATGTACAPGVAVAGAPVYGRSGDVVGAIGALVLDHRRLRQLVPLVRRAARLTSGNLVQWAGV